MAAKAKEAEAKNYAITDRVEVAAELQRRLAARFAPGSLTNCIPRMECADGFDVSVQASRTNYCNPRDNIGPWVAVELGYPSTPMPVLVDYMEGNRAAAASETETVWGYVPVGKVVDLLLSHGGLLASAA